MTFPIQKIRIFDTSNFIAHLFVDYFIFITFIHIEIAVNISLEYTEKFKKISTTRPT